MKRITTKTSKRFAVLFLTLSAVFLLVGCSANETAVDNSKTESVLTENISDDKALDAIKNYCYTANPDLENVVRAGEYPVYWEIVSSDEREIVVLFRSYTGVLIRYYIDRNSGNTRVTEFVPEITSDEQWTDETFNIRDYFE